MNVLMVEPGKVPYEKDIGDGLKAMQDAVGGYIQAVYPYEDPVALVCNEEGKIEGLPLNRALKTEEGEIYDIISGNFFICGLGEENFCSLSPELAEKFKRLSLSSIYSFLFEVFCSRNREMCTGRECDDRIPLPFDMAFRTVNRCELTVSIEQRYHICLNVPLWVIARCVEYVAAICLDSEVTKFCRYTL